jgi:hypothetical protein
MRINEFTNLFSEFDISTAVVFRDSLNPKLWQDEVLIPEIRRGLLEIAKDFIDFIGIQLPLVDITISGSNAAFSYTSYSDIDLHLIVKAPNREELVQLYDAKKNQYNAIHDIKVKGMEVEVYIQPDDQVHHSLGIYSVLNNKWISEPKKEKINIDSNDVKEKYLHYRDKIKVGLKSEELAVVGEIWNDIKRMRKAGLDKNGEFSIENVTFKMLRNENWLGKIKDHMQDLEDKQLSIEHIGYNYEN